MLKLFLDTSVFLQWLSAYDDAIETQAHTNLRFVLNVTIDVLTGHGQHTDPVSQSIIGLNAYWKQVSGLAFKALKHSMPQDNLSYFLNLVQQAAEPFPEFLTCVTNAFEKCIPSGPTKDILIKQRLHLL